MAHYNQEWEDLGRNIQDIVDRAVNSQDYQKLNQTIRQAVGKGGEALRRAVENAPRGNAVPHYQKPKRIVEENRNLPVLYGRTNGKTAGAIAKIVGGSLLSFGTLAGSLGVALLNYLCGIGGGSGLGGVAVVGLAGGIWLLSSGIRTLGWVSRFNTYRKILGEKTHCTLDKLSRGVGKSVKYVRKELQKMIEKGLFLQGHLNKEQTLLITSDEAYRYFEQSRLQLEERQRLEAAARQKREQNPHTQQVQEILDRGDMFLDQIRSCNDAIPGAEISEKISRIEMLVQRIFDRVEANPEVVSDLKKLMDYYLPMTVKLLNAYAEMDAQPVQGETILNSKREIEGTLDTLNLAFEKLLDDLFMDTAMDVSSDISVLHTLLAQEGLTEDELTKMKKQQDL